MSAPVAPFSDWPAASLIAEVKRARRSEQRYKRALSQIAQIQFCVKCGRTQCSDAVQNIARTALKRKQA